MEDRKLSEYFSESEFRCKCGKCKLPANVPSDELLDILNGIRVHFGSPVNIRSGYRCPEHNKRVGGASRSQHTLGSAVDITVKNVKTKDVYEWIEKQPYANKIGLAIKYNPNLYLGFVHIDTRGVKARWVYK